QPPGGRRRATRRRARPRAARAARAPARPVAGPPPPDYTARRAEVPGARRSTKNSPSRWRFRPPPPRTIGLATYRSPGAASTYSRSVLGARGNLGGGEIPCKRPAAAIAALCAHFRKNGIPLPALLRPRKGRDQKFSEPVALSSTSPANHRPCDLPVPGSGFDLLALRARCNGEANRPRAPVQGRPDTISTQFAGGGLSTFPRLSPALGTSLWITRRGARRSGRRDPA